MSSDMIGQFGRIGVFTAFGLFFAFFSLFLSWLVRARGHDPVFRTTYECGPDPVGPAWVQLNVRFYLFALCGHRPPFPGFLATPLTEKTPAYGKSILSHYLLGSILSHRD